MRGGDEELAALLLREHFSRMGTAGAGVLVEVRDPPDLTVRLRCGAVWGVEVTRVYQRVAKIGGGEPTSFETVGNSLEMLGKELGAKTVTPRTRSYVLYLQGKGALSPLWRNVPIKSYTKWKQETVKAVCDHVASGSAEDLRGIGFTLRSVGAGSGWFFHYGPGSHAPVSALEGALSRCFKKKSGALGRWKV